MLFSTKPVQIQWNWAGLQHLCTVSCCWSSLLLCTRSSGPSALLQRVSTVLLPQMCLISGHFCETSWFSRITGPLPHYSVSCCLRQSSHPGGVGGAYIFKNALSLSWLLDRSLILSPSVFSPRMVPRCSILGESLLICFFKSPPEAIILFHLCLLSGRPKSYRTCDGLDSDLPIHLWIIQMLLWPRFCLLSTSMSFPPLIYFIWHCKVFYKNISNNRGQQAR